MKGQNKNQGYRNAIDSLEGFIQQIYWGERLSIEESKNNIENGLVQINLKLKGIHSTKIAYSNGLLITKDGYFLTAKHCIDLDFDYGIIKDWQGRSYQIEKVCAVSKDKFKQSCNGMFKRMKAIIQKKPKKHEHNHDLALVKARMDGPPEPMSYRIFNTDLLKIRLPVALLSYDPVNPRIELQKKFGLVKKINNNQLADLGDGTYTSYPDQFKVTLNTTAELGNSGGIIICPEGKIIGIASIADTTGLTNYLGGIKIFKALELVNFYKRVMMKKLI